MPSRLAAVLAAFVFVACQHVATHDDGTVEVRSFGAGKTTVSAEGAVEVTSPGLSEGLTDLVGYALRAVASFFHVGPVEPTPVEITITTDK
jgi:hypothetical protein